MAVSVFVNILIEFEKTAISKSPKALGIQTLSNHLCVSGCANASSGMHFTYIRAHLTGKKNVYFRSLGPKRGFLSESFGPFSPSNSPLS